MANVAHNGNTCQVTLCLLFLTTTFFIVNSARILDEVEPQPQAIGNLAASGAVNPSSFITGPATTTPQTTSATTLPINQTPAATTTSLVGYEAQILLYI